MSTYTDEVVKYATNSIKLLTLGKSLVFLDDWNDVSELPPVKAIHDMCREGVENISGLSVTVLPGGTKKSADFFLEPYEKTEKDGEIIIGNRRGQLMLAV